MPRHAEDTNTYSMIVVTNKRPDGRFQYKVTLPKRLGDSAMSGAIPVTGEFTLSEVGYGHSDPTVVFRLDRFRNPTVETQQKLMAAEWTELVCLRMCRWMLENLPGGAIRERVRPRIQPNEVLARYEAPREPCQTRQSPRYSHRPGSGH